LIVGLLSFAVGFLPGCAAVNRLHHPDPGLVFAPGDQPDKVLFQKATHEIAHSRYEVGRLTLQTLINTYPDSEYLSKAKLAIADSYYEEGGVSGYTQAEAEYKDFITFFPTAPEAPEAQYRVGMAHFRLLAKADRDQTEALNAEAEFKEFLLKYPDSPLISRVKGRLRQTQEILAQGDFFTAYFYYAHNAFLASRSRFQEIVDKYPDFSGGDEALFYLGQSLEHLRKGHDAIIYYQHILTDFPLSSKTPLAKERLIALKAPIPQPTRAMLARAQADASHHVEKSLFEKGMGLLSSAPDTSATLYGPVHIGVAPDEIYTKKIPGVPPANATIEVSPVNEKSLEPTKPPEPAAPATNEGGKAEPNTPGKTPPASTEPATPANEQGAKAKEDQTDKGQAETANPATPAKKKGKLHIFKKVVHPF
jgi:outer membrane protein assembly factor BamD